MSKKLKSLIDKYTVTREGDTLEGLANTPRYKTDIIALDALLDGGFPKGHMISISTEEGGGKSTLISQACGNIIEKYDKKVYYFDVEGGVTPELLNSMGYIEHLYHPQTNPEGKFIRLRAKFIQEIAQVFKEIIEDKETAVIVIDSTTATEDRKILEDEELGTGKNSVGSHARMWSSAARAFGALIADTDVTLVMIHQARENLSNFIVRTEAARGRALKHATSVEIWGTISKWLDSEGKELKGRTGAGGTILRLTTTKNRLTKPFMAVKMPLIFGKGASNMWAYRDFLENKDVIDEVTGEATKMLNVKGGGHFELHLPSGSHKGQGGDAITDLIEENIEEILELYQADGGMKLSAFLED